MQRPAWIPRATLVPFLLLAGAQQATADDARGGEVGFVVAGYTPDSEMTGDSGAIEPAYGLRGGTVFSPYWGISADFLYSTASTENGLGDARTMIGRASLDRLFTPGRERRWLVSFGAGWMVVDFKDAAFEDFHNPLASLGGGQRIRLSEKLRLRWELRVDHTLDDARLDNPLTQGLALVALSWGPSGAPAGGSGGSTAGDEDGDGVRDGHDACPGTPHGAVVDRRGCPLDGDRDGVPDGIDRCARSRPGEPVGPDGCASDGDHDGVPDVTDACPDTLPGATVDEWGCPRDEDGDAVLDGLDACPRTPRSAIVDARGCPQDEDGDGVLDGLDQCPGTSAGKEVDVRGCSEDADGDGVPDERDDCPDTPAGSRVVDSRGCPRRAALEGEHGLEGVSFENGSAELTGDSFTTLDRVARVLDENGALEIEIAGHTDDRGDDAKNLELSKRRAEAVRDYLIARGIEAGRLVARGYGEREPIAGNDTPEGRAQNRRVELHVAPR